MLLEVASKMGLSDFSFLVIMSLEVPLPLVWAGFVDSL